VGKGSWHEYHGFSGILHVCVAIALTGLLLLIRFRSIFRARAWLAILVCSAGFWVASVALGGADFDRLLASITQRWGSAAGPKFNGWRALIAGVGGLPDSERLKRTNDFFNRQIQFGEDIVIWSQEDYWATPMETLGRGAGDCEDFVIAKYYTLKEMGVGGDKLRLIYVRAKTGSSVAAPTQAHMVLGYYAQPDAEPLVLDNLVGEIRPASRRPDLVPVFSFNSQGVFTGTAGKDGAPAGGVGRLSRWEDLLKRARLEGFE
jgi:predicted transglutaminase-like cysteine proteinase